MIYRNNIGAYTSLVKKILLSTILALLICNTVSAQNSPFPLKRQDYLDANKKELEKIFNSIDKDGDGKITKDEFYANPLKDAAARFDNTDTNKDGIVTLEEENAAVAKAKKQEADAKKKQAEQKKDSTPAPTPKK
ncbi:MAG: EF-hand domain-containing protein [Candidatus Fonsibacter lacus]|nr:EF-hand domain-containing protein [Candidatus Fonsibacter lacus]